MNKTKKRLFTLVGALAVFIAILVLVQPTFFARDNRGNVTEFNHTITEDKMNNGGFIQEITLGLDDLADDFNNLPEIQDGFTQEEIKAAELIANLMRSPDPEVQQGLQLTHAVPLYYNHNDKVLRTGQCSVVEDGTIYYRAQKVPYDNFHGDIHLLFEIESSDGMLFLKGIPIGNVLS